ncbi:MAG TPA: S-adenosylmethionine:tRNA ribosyltransferase-isomerase [Candidatus Saccharimonadales bacterium]|nr:S-adenosylmethionine:tRNA ribosyltransferase-isomerase [Candidatus Saccharimonadales bacterium]
MIAAPRELRASLPAELRGRRRDGARLCVVDRAAGRIRHTTVARIGEHLAPGDLLVVNSSRTLPAALRVERDGAQPLQLRPGALRDGEWDALALETAPPHRNVPLRAGEILRAPGGLRLRVLEPRGDAPLLWRMSVLSGDPVRTLLSAGEPIRYSYVPHPVPLEHYQTVYAGVPGSVETPSAGRHLTWELLGDLRRHGVGVTDIVLHCGLSSFQDDDVDLQKPLIEERFAVRRDAAASINGATRIVAVGTSVIRALETAVDGGGDVRPVSGWTRLVITPHTRLQVVDALLTGLHEPPATHLDMLGALLEQPLLERAYSEVRERGYLWHEFGDAMLIL